MAKKSEKSDVASSDDKKTKTRATKSKASSAAPEKKRAESKTTAKAAKSSAKSAKADTSSTTKSTNKSAAKSKASAKKAPEQAAQPTRSVEETAPASENPAPQAKPEKKSPAAPAKATLIADAEQIEARVGDDKATRKQIKKRKAQLESFAQALRVEPGFELADVDASSTPAFDGRAKKAEKLMRKTSDELADLQERLYAGQRHPGGHSVLLVVQGMDTSGKGGIMRHVIGHVDPQGVELTAFKQPTKEELEHPFLWRIRRALPKPGYIGVFDRSQYEDVLVVRVHDLVARPVWMRRYSQINAFEKSVVADNTTIIKVMLHVDADEQKARLAERLENPEKFYKFNPGDLTERKYWHEYQEAYQALLERTSTDYAPWFVVPANHKWYTRLAVQQLLLEHLRALDLTWPDATFDVEEQKARLAEL